MVIKILYSILEFILQKEEDKISLNGQWKYYVLNDNPPPVGHLPGRLSAFW